MSSAHEKIAPVADAARGNWVDSYAPAWLKPYARVARWDRPIGFWLLFWPCGMALALVAVATGTAFNWWYLVLMLAGAILMRGAGCTFNDIVDADLDAKVERTRLRPIPSGQLSRRSAILFLGAQALGGLLVLIQFNLFTVILGVASLGLVAIYPFMKRITWWPQFFLGLAFSWGALVGWSAVTASLALPALVLYAASILWTIGYDTIYALQDVEDDALIGVRSTARLFGERARTAVAGIFAAAFVLFCIAGWLAGGRTVFLLAMALPAAVLVWQIVTLDLHDPENALVRFKANHWAGLGVTLALLIETWV